MKNHNENILTELLLKAVKISLREEQSEKPITTKEKENEEATRRDIKRTSKRFGK